MAVRPHGIVRPEAPWTPGDSPHGLGGVGPGKTFTRLAASAEDEAGDILALPCVARAILRARVRSSTAPRPTVGA
jgi:hypothetical protein